MAGRTPAEAVEAFLAPLRLAVSCVTPAVLNVSGGYHATDRPHALVLGNGDPVKLAGESRLSLSLRQNYRIVEFEGPRGPWKVQTVAYAYRLDAPAGELIAYHWHPQGLSTVTSPHLHLGAGAELGFALLQGAHVPTGRIAIEDLLRLAIGELAVQPLRDDWREVLEGAQAGYEAWRTWPTPKPPPG